MAIPTLHEMIRALIAEPSVSSARADLDQGNQSVIALLHGWLEDLGFAVETMRVSDTPPKLNLIARLGDGDGGLVLSGHTDTVPYDPGQWTHDPFTATQVEGRLYGLGSADMKSFLAICVEVAKSIDASKLHAPLTILATADEESTMNGARALVAAGYPRARMAVIGEPTGLVPVRMHKGIMMERIHLEGRSGHSSDPNKGASALEGMVDVLRAIREWRSELQRGHRHEAFAVDVPTLNLGWIAGGDSPNRICAGCTLDLDLRPLPGMALEPLRAALGELARSGVQDQDLHVVLTSLQDGVPPFEEAADSVLVQLAEELTGKSATAVAFGTEAPFLQQLGMEVVVLGPGDIEVAHKPDEHLPLEQLQPTQEIIRGLIERVCAGASHR